MITRNIATARASKPSLSLRLSISLLAAACAGRASAAELEEIVVTAQKRTEDLQKVGIAISAYTAAELRDVGARSLRDVTAITPNVTLFDEYGSGQPTWVIRGVGLADFNANNTPTAAIYVDDVYMTSNVMGGIGLFDLQQVEVLKGPQGALYGRNTSGGAVRVMSNAPVKGLTEGYGSFTYGRWDDAIAEGAVNLPIGDAAALRFSGRWNQSGEGWQESMVTGKKYGKKDLWSARAMLLTDIGDSTELLVNVHGSADNSQTPLGRGMGLYDAETGGFCAAVLAGHQDDEHCAMEATFYDPQFRYPAVQGDSGRKTLSDPINQFDNDGQGASVRLTSEFEAATLTSITAYEHFNYGLTFDYDGSSGEFAHQHAKSQIEAWSEEVRLASTTSGPLSWLVGLEFAKDDLSEDRDFGIASDLGIVAAAGFDRANMLYDQTTKSMAGYGQVGWQFSDAWKLDLGVRYTDESKSYHNGDFVTYLGSDVIPYYLGLKSDTDLQIWSWKAGLNWTPTDNVLLYGSIAKGFKSGGFFGGFPAEGEDSITPYKAETNIAYEIGVKSQWFDNTLRLNGSVFYYDYQDAQGWVTILNIINTPSTRLGTVGDAVHKGAEVDLTWQATERLNLQASAGWLDAKITDSNMTSLSWLGTDVPLKGMDRANAPDFSYSARGRYEVPVGTMKLAMMADYSWRDSVAGDALSVIEATMRKPLKAYGLLGARVALSADDDHWELALWGKNLMDEKYTINVNTDDVASWMKIPGEPINYGLDLSYRWK